MGALRAGRGIARRPRVLLLVENVPLARDHRLRKQAQALVRNGYDVTVVCRRDARNRTCVNGVRVLQYPAPPEGSGPVAFVVEYAYSLLMAAVLTAWVLVRRGVDVVQLASTPDIYFVLAVPLRLLGKAVLLDFRDLSPETYAARYGSAAGAMHRMLLLLERLSLRSADEVIVVNGSLAQIACDRGGVPAQRVTTVGNGPVLERVSRGPANPDLRRGRRHLCCWVGMIGPQDRVDLALRAVQEFVHVRGRKDTQFTFAGVGDALPDAERLADELQVQPWVAFPGWAEEDEVFAYLSTADLGIEPNLDDFVSPVKVMEYMAAGLPFVGFETTETARLAGSAASLVAREDVAAMARRIEALLDDPRERQEMGRQGQDRVRQVLAWECQEVAYLKVFRGRLDQAARTRSDRKEALR